MLRELLRSALPDNAVSALQRLRRRYRVADYSIRAQVMARLARPLIRKSPEWISLYRKLEDANIHVLPINYHSPLPVLRELEARTNWREPTDLSVMRWNDEEEASLLKALSQLNGELATLPAYGDVAASSFGPGYGEIEAITLYGLLRHFKPRRMIEVGSGLSTYYACLALERNAQEHSRPCHLTCIEPHPHEALRSIRGISELRVAQVQDVPAEFFRQLQAGDILFIDSSHAVRIGGDVNFLFLEVLPTLQPGVIVHVDDVHFPRLCPPDPWIFAGLSFWQEEAMLKALLTHNDQIEIIFCCSKLHACDPPRLRSALPRYDPKIHEPASIWLRRLEPQNTDGATWRSPPVHV